MNREARAIDRLASIYAAKFEARAMVIVGDRISEAIGAGRWDDVQKWQRLRARILAKYGMTI